MGECFHLLIDGQQVCRSLCDQFLEALAVFFQFILGAL
jgi:hypothetical protein